MKKTATVLACLFVVTAVLCFQAIGADKQLFCNNYADTAVKQYNLGKQHNLPGIVPPAWSNDRNGHYNWCMFMPENVVSNETTKRQVYLDQHLPPILSAKKVPVVGSAVKKNGSAVAATPISIPRPMKMKTQEAIVQKAGYVTLRDIEKAALISLDKNLMQVRLRYRVEPSIADKLYAGAFLYDADMQAINAGYKPTQELKSPEGDVDITLVLPENPFHAATIQVFLIQSGKVIVKKYFKCPFIWDGNKGKISRPIAKSTDFTSKQNTVPSASMLSLGKGKQWVPVGHGLPVGFDPGRGP
ncbi:MAG: hypothetical protein L3J57_10185 [Desulfuromusa sp.]|nr:hypothetical protein [Desulfuromusa sp.]